MFLTYGLEIQGLKGVGGVGFRQATDLVSRIRMRCCKFGVGLLQASCGSCTFVCFDWQELMCRTFCQS